MGKDVYWICLIPHTLVCKTSRNRGYKKLRVFTGEDRLKWQDGVLQYIPHNLGEGLSKGIEVISFDFDPFGFKQ